MQKFLKAKCGLNSLNMGFLKDKFQQQLANIPRVCCALCNPTGQNLSPSMHFPSLIYAISSCAGFCVHLVSALCFTCPAGTPLVLHGNSHECEERICKCVPVRELTPQGALCSTPHVRWSRGKMYYKGERGNIRIKLPFIKQTNSDFCIFKVIGLLQIQPAGPINTLEFSRLSRTENNRVNCTL